MPGFYNRVFTFFGTLSLAVMLFAPLSAAAQESCLGPSCCCQQDLKNSCKKTLVVLVSGLDGTFVDHASFMEYVALQIDLKNNDCVTVFEFNVNKWQCAYENAANLHTKILQEVQSQKSLPGNCDGFCSVQIYAHSAGGAVASLLVSDSGYGFDVSSYSSSVSLSTTGTAFKGYGFNILTFGATSTFAGCLSAEMGTGMLSLPGTVYGTVYHPLSGLGAPQASVTSVTHFVHPDDGPHLTTYQLKGLEGASFSFISGSTHGNIFTNEHVWTKIPKCQSGDFSPYICLPPAGAASGTPSAVTGKIKPSATGGEPKRSPPPAVTGQCASFGEGMCGGSCPLGSQCKSINDSCRCVEAPCLMDPDAQCIPGETCGYEVIIKEKQMGEIYWESYMCVALACSDDCTCPGLSEDD